jgi:AbiV family abortive infection protein
VLLRATVAAARNAEGLLYDAQVLADAGSAARACSLAALAVEEAGKAANLGILTVMPEVLRARAPVGRMLEWHQLKQVHGLFLASMPYRVPEIAPWIAALPASELAQVLTAVRWPADETDRLKRRGLYADVGPRGLIREPSEITEGEVLSQLTRAGQAARAVGQMLEPETHAGLVNPTVETVEFSRAAVSALTEARYARTPEDATNVVLNAVGKFRRGIAARESEGPSVPSELWRRRTRHTQRARQDVSAHTFRSQRLRGSPAGTTRTQGA